MSNKPYVTDIRPNGEHATTFFLALEITDIHLLCQHLLSQFGDPAWQCIPTTNSLTVINEQHSQQHIQQRVESLLPHSIPVSTNNSTNHHSIAVCYHPQVAPDLLQVAEQLACTVEDIVACHSQTHYRVDMLGFLPGFAYLSGLSKTLHLPRRQSPRTRVPAGSVAIAGDKTAIYPSDSPGGWHIIGATNQRLVQPTSPTPVLLSPLDTVSFVSIELDQFQAQRRP